LFHGCIFVGAVNIGFGLEAWGTLFVVFFLSSPYEGKLCCVEAGTRGVMVEFFKLKHGRSKHVFLFIF
jgi:hypothetical protein